MFALRLALLVPPTREKTGRAMGGTQELNAHCSADIGPFKHCTTFVVGVNGGSIDASRYLFWPFSRRCGSHYDAKRDRPHQIVLSDGS